MSFPIYRETPRAIVFYLVLLFNHLFVNIPSAQVSKTVVEQSENTFDSTAKNSRIDEHSNTWTIQNYIIVLTDWS